MSSTANVFSAHAGDVAAAKTADVTSAEATDVTSAKAADVASATSVASAASVSSAAATAGLRISGKKAAGKHGTCQNHHHSSSHEILLWDGRTFRHRPCQTPACPRKANADVAMD
jgi:hypothetical protein